MNIVVKNFYLLNNRIRFYGGHTVQIVIRKKCGLENEKDKDMQSNWQKGSFQEKRIKGIIERGEYDGREYSCIVSQRSKFFRQDFWGHDIVCVGLRNWLLCQVKYEKDRKPPKKKKTVDTMLAVSMPESTKRVLARVDGRDQKIYWDEY